jgi:hypothetical protein
MCQSFQNLKQLFFDYIINFKICKDLDQKKKQIRIKIFFESFSILFVILIKVEINSIIILRFE